MAQTQAKLYGCSPIDQYTLTTKLGEGTFGQVHRGVFKPTATAVALKEIIIREREDGIPITALREIKIMKALRHPNILRLLDMAVSRRTSGGSAGGDRSGGDRNGGDRNSLGARDRSSTGGEAAPAERRALSTYYMVMAYMDHDLCGLLHNRDIRFTLPHIKLYVQQLLEGMAYLHASGYMHRDIKSANVLVSNDGMLRIADFGLARRYFEAPPSLQAATPATHKYTPKVVTRWYRPPELLLGDQYYTTAIDMWGVGCIFGEFFKRQVVLAGQSDADQIHLIFKLVGTPTDESWAHFPQLPGARELLPLPERAAAIDEVFHNVPADARDLLRALLALDPAQRLTARGALAHRFLTEGPPPADPDTLPAFPSSREIDVRRSRDSTGRHRGADEDHHHHNGHNTRPPPRRALRAFQPKIPDKRELSALEQIPPYRRMDAKRRTSFDHQAPFRKQRKKEAAPSTVMNNGLDY